jgi:WD40 repeat protein
MSKFNRNLAFVIGINDYHNGIPRLRNAVNDAKKLVEILRENHKYTVWICLDEVASLNNLNKLLEETLPQQVTADDRLIFYFAGHGIALNGEDGPEGYLIPQDARLGDTKTYLPMTRLHDCLSKLPCRHFLGILDCCFAGAFRWSTTRDLLTVPKIIHKERYDRFITDPAWQVITSAASDEKALDALTFTGERGDIGNNSPFASALFEALGGLADAYPPSVNGKRSGDGVITATELYLYIRDRVEVGTEDFQTPGIWALNKHDKGEYIFLTPGHTLNLPPAPALDESKNPYQGLESFDKEHKNLFFGRSSLVDKLYEFVENNPFTIVLGASGSGKSSLVKAGLIPKLEESKDDKWFILDPIRPGESPFRSLNNTLQLKDIPQVYIQNEDSLSKAISTWASSNQDSKLILLVDQSEELVTLCHSEEERKSFFQQIAIALANHPQRLRVVLTLRSDFEPQLREAGLKFITATQRFGKTIFNSNWQTGRFIVPAMTRSELREAIEKPAETRVMYFDPHDLVELLIDEVAGMPGALPLLSFALSELYLKYLARQREASIGGKTIDRAITLEDYKEIGGVIQSLTGRADEEYCKLVQLDATYEQIVKNVMLRMVALGSGELARRRVHLEELGYPEKIQPQVLKVIKQFSSVHLLVNGTDSDNKPFVEPAHDALVQGWQRLKDWVQDEKNLGLQRRLTPAASEWKSKQNRSYLWHNDPYLDVLQNIKSTDKSWLNEVEAEFVKQSVKRREREVWLWRGGFTLAILFISGVALNQWIRTQDAEIRTLASSSESLFASNRQLDALIDGIKAEKKLKFMARLPISIQSETKTQVMNALQQALYWAQENNRWESGQSQIRSVRFNPSGNIIASASDDGSIKFWNLDGTLIEWKENGKRKTILSGHKGRVNNIEFSRDGKVLASAGWDNNIQLWDMNHRKIIKPLTGHKKEVFSVSFSPNGQILASGSWDRTIKLWDIKTGKLKKTFPPNPQKNFQKVNVVSFNHNGDLIASSYSDGKIRLWNLFGKVVRTFLGHQDQVIAVRFSQDGKILASASFDNTIKLWDVTTGKKIETIKGHNNKVYSLSFSRDAKTLISAGSDNVIKQWNLEDLNDIKEIETLEGHSKAIYSVRLSPDDKTLVSAGADTTIRLWNVNTSKSLTYPKSTDKKSLVSKPQKPTQLALKKSRLKQNLPLSKTSSIPNWQGKVIEGREIQRFLGYKNSVTSISFHPKNTTIATASEGEKKIILWSKVGKDWDVKTLSGHANTVNYLTFSPNGQILASASADGTVKFWNSAKGTYINELGNKKQSVQHVSFSLDGKIIATTDKKNLLQLWSFNNLKEEIKLPNQIKGSVSKFIPHSNMIATAVDYNRKSKQYYSIKLWNVTDGKEIKEMNEHEGSIYAISVSPDGKFIASASGDKTIKIWDVNKEKAIKTLYNHKGEVRDVSFSPDGKILASSSADNTIKLWDTQNYNEIATLRGHSAPVYSISFNVSDDGQFLASGGNDKTVLLWKLDVLNRDNLLNQACKRVQDYLRNRNDAVSNLCADVNY